jgi:PAS domain S-box-containing protein
VNRERLTNRQRLSLYAHLAAGLCVFLILIALTSTSPWSSSELLPIVLFCGLIVFTDTFGVRLLSGMVSLLPMMTVTAYLVIGLVPSGWAAFMGTFIHAAIRARWAETLEIPSFTNRRRFLSLMAINAMMHTGSILVGGIVFQALGGALPLRAVTTGNFLPLIALGFSYLVFNYGVAGIVIATRSHRELKEYVQSLPSLFFYEGAPLIFAPLVALIYTRLGLLSFLLFITLMVIASLITRSLARTSRRLERRVKELDSLQAVGRVLSSSLNINTILMEIYTQVAALMPARNFYVALYDSETDEVSFPLAIENGQRVQWRSRRAGSGMTEYVLHSRQPLLLRKSTETALERMGIDHIGTTAASWVGVPILAEQEPIGVIAIQSYTTVEAYDVSHQEVLVTIAAQAAVAIQNARLYERTDEALARRLQELASVLRTTGEGILLLDVDYRVLAANRALANFLGIAQTEIAHRTLDKIDPQQDHSFLAMIGFDSIQALADACADVGASDARHRQIVVTSDSSERHLERTLTPVHDREGAITGWLFVFRDISEEIELAQLRENMMHMLVHDLRSPLAVLRSSMDMLEATIDDRKFDQMQQLTTMARRNTDRMLRMVNELLDISKLESGELPLQPRCIQPELLLRGIASRLSLLARDANVTLELKTNQDLPDLYVDETFIERVLYNLVDNAIKFTPDHGTVRLWARSDPENADALLLGVTDTGYGIPPEEQRLLFEKFQQTSVPGRRIGTGLGLPFCKLAVEAHGGQIWVESEVEKGSTFIMRLPTKKG